jgi:tetratricopeptide (TPR) repeat protein
VLFPLKIFAKCRQVKSYRKAVEIHPQHCEAYFNMGVLYHSHGRLDLSIPAYEKALEIEPLHFDAISNLGSAKHKQGDLDGAVDMYQRAIEILEQGQGDTEQVPHRKHLSFNPSSAPINLLFAFLIVCMKTGVLLNSRVHTIVQKYILLAEILRAPRDLAPARSPAQDRERKKA